MIDRRIKIRHIQSFAEIARVGSLKRAAEVLLLTQPAISRTLKELEEIVGEELLVRSRAGVSLTKQGEVFLHFAKMSLAALQQGLDGVEHAGAQGKVRLVVGAMASVASNLMPNVVEEFSALAPHCVLEISIGPLEYMAEQLRLGQLDMVVGRMGPPEAMQGISFTQLYREEVAFLVRTGHPLLKDPVLQRIGEWQVILPPRGAVLRALVERYLIENGVGDIPRRLETISGAFCRVYARRCDAIWVATSGVVANELADGHLVRLPFETSITKGPVGLMTRPDSVAGPMEQLFRVALNKCVAEMDAT